MVSEILGDGQPQPSKSRQVNQIQVLFVLLFVLPVTKCMPIQFGFYDQVTGFMSIKLPYLR